jgi:hypothetical protein
MQIDLKKHLKKPILDLVDTILEKNLALEWKHMSLVKSVKLPSLTHLDLVIIEKT